MRTWIPATLLSAAGPQPDDFWPIRFLESGHGTVTPRQERAAAPEGLLWIVAELRPDAVRRHRVGRGKHHRTQGRRKPGRTSAAVDQASELVWRAGRLVARWPADIVRRKNLWRCV